MAHMKPLDRAEVPELHDFFATFEERMGFLPNSLLTMARNPEVVQAFAALGRAVYKPTESVPLQLRNMIAHVASRAAGCLYCQAHTASNARRPASDLDGRKLEEIWSFETSDLFTDRERAALSFAVAAASVPNAATPEHFDAMRRHFSEKDIVDILALVSYFGYLNRWNDSMATDLEAGPTEIGEAFLGGSGWRPGKHGG